MVSQHALQEVSQHALQQGGCAIPACIAAELVAGSLELAYSLIWGSHKIWGKGGGDTLDLS